MPRSAVLALALLLPGVACPALADSAAPSHASSPDWRDQIVYFVLLDRFDDGEPGNNDQGAGEHDPSDHRRYSGGDLPGLLRRLDYIQGLGATAVWITPPVANQWWDGSVGYGGYHGYWARDFSRVDEHYGSLDDYRRLATGLHARDMRLVQDIVLNHTGNFFRYDPEAFDPADPAAGYALNPDSRPTPAPTQPPFDMNDPRDPAQRAAGIYHWTPDVSDYSDRHQELRWQMSGLDDLDTANPAVRRALRQSYGHWIGAVGVDAYRVDTAFYVPREFLHDFLHADDAEAPGILHVARATGRNDFHVFGEGFAVDRPFEDAQARRIEAYTEDEAGRPALPAMINFPLYGSLGDVFARGMPSAVLGDRIRRMMAVHARPHLMPSFIDNHDVDRFLAGGSEAAMKQALLALLTLPGIPTIYYGTEQGFTATRASMFAAGWGSGGRDHFDTDAPLYRWLAAAIALRRAHPVLSRGEPVVLAENAAAPGGLAWRMDHDGSAALVAFNTAGHPILLDIADTGLPAGTRLRGVYAIDREAGDAVVGEGGRLTLELPAHAGQVWLPEGTDETTSSGEDGGAARAPGTIRLDPLPARVTAEQVRITGRASPGVGHLLLVRDEALPGAIEVFPRADGRFEARLPVGDLVDPAREHRVMAWSPETGARSRPMGFHVAREWTLLAEADDPPGDDRGPAGRYSYPTDPGFAPRPGDIRQVRLQRAGDALRVELDMAAISQGWSPPNGFDRVAFTLFIELPGREDGATVMPLQNAALPAGMRWHYRLRAHGWSNALFTPEGADAGSEGRPSSPGAQVAVDLDSRTVAFTFPAGALGPLGDARGLRVHATTWDYDGGYRALAPEPGRFTFGGGDGARDPKVLDAVTVRVP